MRSRKLRSLRWAVALALVTCTGLVPTTEATGATFTIEGIFGDSTAFSGELEIDLWRGGG